MPSLLFILGMVIAETFPQGGSPRQHLCVSHPLRQARAHVCIQLRLHPYTKPTLEHCAEQGLAFGNKDTPKGAEGWQGSSTEVQHCEMWGEPPANSALPCRETSSLSSAESMATGPRASWETKWASSPCCLWRWVQPWHGTAVWGRRGQSMGSRQSPHSCALDTNYAPVVQLQSGSVAPTRIPRNRINTYNHHNYSKHIFVAVL